MKDASHADQALSCRGVEKSLGGKRVLQALDLDVHPAEVVSLLGASGSGKTTLLRIIAGLMMPDAGRIALMGAEVWSPSLAVPPERRRIGMVFQDYALWPHMTVEGNLAFGLRAQRLPAPEVKARIDHAIEVARLGPQRDRLPAALSGGQQQRVAIARCLAARPQLMLFDEPLSNLDAALREDLRTEMMDLVRREGITVVYVTHDQAEAMAVSDRIAVMREGQIAQLDTPQRLYDTPATPFVASFIGGFTLLPGVAGPQGFHPDGAVPMGLTCDASGPFVLVIRPEDARPAALHPGTCLSGTVRACAYQGRCWRISIQVGAYVLRLDWHEPVDPGKDLSFSLPPERCTLIAA